MENIQQMSKEEKIEMIKNRNRESNIFHETHKIRMEVKPNVEYVVLLSKDWYITPQDDPEKWIMRDESREWTDPKTNKSKTIKDTTYRVRQLQSTDPLFLQELHLSETAAEFFKSAIEKIAVTDPDRDIIIKFMKEVGSNQFDVNWKVECSLA